MLVNNYSFVELKKMAGQDWMVPVQLILDNNMSLSENGTIIDIFNSTNNSTNPNTEGVPEYFGWISVVVWYVWNIN